MSQNQSSEPFPTLPQSESEDVSSLPDLNTTTATRTRIQSIRHHASVTRTRGESLLQTFVNSNPPLGMWQATGEVGSKIPTLPEIRNGAFSADGWTHEGQLEGRGSNPHEIHQLRLARTISSPSPTESSPPHGRVDYVMMQTPSATISTHPLPQGPENIDIPKAHPYAETNTESKTVERLPPPSLTSSSLEKTMGPDETGTYPNGYRFPKKHTWGQATIIGLKAFGRFVITPFGFLITVYGLNVIGWGAMIFFVLLNAAPAMCVPSCDADDSPRKIWIEIDSQVLNALFCVTGFGLIPWRFRDFYYLMGWRLRGNQIHHRRLAGIYRGWYRLPGSQHLADDVAPPPVYSKKNPQTPESPPPYTDEEIAKLEENPALPIPATSMPDAPLTGIRAAPSRSWTLDFVIWMYLLNTIFQAALAGCMWAFNRFNRPAWTTALFIVLGCLTGIFAGILVFIEGKKIKKAEGIPVKEFDLVESPEDFQLRKAREEAKAAKKTKSRERRRTEKVKGQDWFSRN